MSPWGGEELLIEANWSDQKKDINFAYECFKLRRLKQKSYSHNGSHPCLFMLYIIQHMKWHFVTLRCRCRDWWHFTIQVTTDWCWFAYLWLLASQTGKHFTLEAYYKLITFTLYTRKFFWMYRLGSLRSWDIGRLWCTFTTYRIWKNLNAICIKFSLDPKSCGCLDFMSAYFYSDHMSNVHIVLWMKLVVV